MATIANGAATSVPTREVSVSKQPKRQFEILRGGASLGWCVPCYDGRGAWYGWQAIANLQPAGGFCCADVQEFERLKPALAFVTQNGVAL